MSSAPIRPGSPSPSRRTEEGLAAQRSEDQKASAVVQSMLPELATQKTKVREEVIPVLREVVETEETLYKSVQEWSDYCTQHRDTITKRLQGHRYTEEEIAEVLKVCDDFNSALPQLKGLRAVQRLAADGKIDEAIDCYAELMNNYANYSDTLEKGTAAYFRFIDLNPENKLAGALRGLPGIDLQRKPLDTRLSALMQRGVRHEMLFAEALKKHPEPKEEWKVTHTYIRSCNIQANKKIPAISMLPPPKKISTDAKVIQAVGLPAEEVEEESWIQTLLDYLASALEWVRDLFWKSCEEEGITKQDVIEFNSLDAIRLELMKIAPSPSGSIMKMKELYENWGGLQKLEKLGKALARFQKELANDPRSSEVKELLQLFAQVRRFQVTAAFIRGEFG